MSKKELTDHLQTADVRNLICIGCPMGCALAVTMKGKEILDITGNTCKHGAEYARKEVTAPSRVLTTTVPVAGRTAQMVSVKTRTDIPKEKLFPVLQELKKIEVSAPVYIGDVVLKNAAGTGVDVIATKNVE